jgi:rhodanese-related sulfurtransferase
MNTMLPGIFLNTIVAIVATTLISPATLAAESQVASQVAPQSAPGIAMISQEALLERQQRGDASLLVLDVRTPGEYVSGHVPGAVNIPHDQVAARLAEVPKDKDVVVYCRSGRRTNLALNLLAENGYTRLGHLEGDMLAWQERQRPLEVPRDPAACAAALEGGKPAPEVCAAQ